MACPYTYQLNLSGDCNSSNSGAFELIISGTAQLPAYTIGWENPFTNSVFLTGNTYSYVGLSAGTYSFYIYDNCNPPTPRTLVSFRISSGSCVSISAVEDTTCGFNNGSLTASTQYQIGTPKFYLYNIDSTYITSATSLNQNVTFSNLSASTYYVIGDDGGGCTGRSETVIVKNSTTLTYDLYVVDSSNCFGSNGRVYINNINGYPPYSYLWSNGETTSYITGLTNGVYSVSVTDNTGCVTTQQATVNSVPPMVLINTEIITPTCFNNDGQLTIMISGGTAPYTYSGSNGVIESTFSPTYVFSGIGQGGFGVEITDAGLCKYNTSVPILIPNSFNIVSIGVTNVTCSTPSGIINISINGGTPPYTYSLLYPDGTTSTQSLSTTATQFSSLSAGTYTLTISNNGPCVYTNTYEILNNSTFDFSANTIGTTCDLSNGSVTIELSTGGTAPYTYQITGQPLITTGSTNYTYTNLSQGLYTATVTDGLGCAVIEQFVITGKTNLNFSLIGTNPTTINNGQISAYITDGEPLFNLNWSPNVGGQTGLTINNLSAGTYTLSVTDSNGCTLERSITLYGYNSIVSYEVFNVCDGNFQNNGLVIIKKPQQMFLEGFYDLTSGETNCVLNQANFIAEVSVGGVSSDTVYYISNSLGDYPSDNDWYNAIEGLLEDYPQIGNVIFSSTSNSITIETQCSEGGLSVNDTGVVINFKITYDISCTCKVTPVIGPYIETCDMIYNTVGQTINTYNYTLNSSILLTVPNYNFNSNSIGYTQNYLYAIEPNSNGGSIYKWQITLTGFVAGFIGTIGTSSLINGSFAVKDDNTIICVNTGTTPNTIIEVNVNNGNVVNKFQLPINREVQGAMMLNQSGDKLYIFNVDVTNASFYSYFYSQYDYNLGVMDYEIDTSSTITDFAGQFVNGTSIYLVDNNRNIFQITNTPSYINFSSSMDGSGAVNSVTQLRNCFTVKPILESCMGTCDVYFMSSGYDFIDYDFSTNTYEVLTYSPPISNPIGFAKTFNKCWFNTTNQIFEVDIYYNCPIWLNYNVTITPSISLSNGLAYYDSNTLIGSTVTTFPGSVVSINSTTGNATILFPLSSPPNLPRVVANTILVTDSGKYLITTTDAINSYLTQYDSLGNIEVDIVLPTTSSYGIWVSQNTLYVCDVFSLNVYSVNTTTHVVTFNYTLSISEMSGIGSFMNSQYRECVNIELVP